MASVEVIAEWGPPRSLEYALEQAQATKEAGADWAKWQLLHPARLCSPDAARYWDRRLGGAMVQRDNFRIDPLKRADWGELRKACEAEGIGFLVTPFDLGAVDVLAVYGARAFKIASGDITYRQLIERVAEYGRRVFLSTGASTEVEIERALTWLGGCDVTLLACDLVYPCPEERAQLHRIERLATAFGLPVGYSDHTVEVWTAEDAVDHGATVLEKHCTLDRNGGTPDDRMALLPAQLEEYVHLAKNTRRGPLREPPIVAPTRWERAARVQARRACYAKVALPPGHALTFADVSALRPCPVGALEPWQIDRRVLSRPVRAGELLMEADCRTSRS